MKRHAQSTTVSYMNNHSFADLVEALENALAFERGEHKHLNVTLFEAPLSRKNSTNEKRSGIVAKKGPSRWQR
jgi:hypothetical protein